MGRNSSCFCGSGLKQKNCHPDINENSALALLLKKFYEFDSIVKNESDNISTPCSRGCSACCHDYFYVSHLEYYAIQNYVFSNNLKVEPFIHRALAQQDEIKKRFPKEYKQTKSYMPTRMMKPLHDPSESFFDDRVIRSLNFPCPFLDEETQSCVIYPVRPFICRGYGLSVQFGACEKCIGEKMIPPIIPLDLYQRNVDLFSYRNSDCLMRPYPLSNFVADRKFIKVPSYFAATSRSIEEYVQATMKR